MIFQCILTKQGQNIPKILNRNQEDNLQNVTNLFIQYKYWKGIKTAVTRNQKNTDSCLETKASLANNLWNIFGIQHNKAFGNAPIWSRVHTYVCSETQTKKLQTGQNTALRTITGCLLSHCDDLVMSLSHLLSESWRLPVNEHNAHLFKLFLLECIRRNHPCSHLQVTAF